MFLENYFLNKNGVFPELFMEHVITILCHDKIQLLSKLTKIEILGTSRNC